MKRLILLTACITMLTIGYTNEKVYAAPFEQSIAGIGVVLNKIDPIEIKYALEIKYQYTTERVNLRSEASTNSDILITLDNRSKVEILKSTSSDWTKVRYNNKVGYIYSKYLRDTELPSLDFTDEEIEILQRITEAEATEQSIKSKENVASTIINRVMSVDFPDDIESVVFEDGQFSPISDKRFYKVKITKDTIKAVDNVLRDGVTHDCLYFANIKDIEQLSYKKWFQCLKYQFKDNSGHSYFK